MNKAAPTFHPPGPAQDGLQNNPSGGTPPDSPPVRRLRDPDGRPVDDPEVDRKRQGRRLLEARLKNRYRTASEAARALGIAGPTYLAHENGTRQIRPDIAGYYAHKFSISTDWLLYGRGSMSNEPADDAAPRRAPQDDRASPESPGLARLLHALKVRRAPDGSFARLDVSNEPGRLLPMNLTDGHVPELGHAYGDPSECLVAISDAPDPVLLALRDVLRVPADMVERVRMFAAKLPNNSLFTDMPGGQRVLVDPDDVPDDAEIEDEGLFMVATSRGLLVPAYVSRPEPGAALQITRSRAKPVTSLSSSDGRILGRIVMQLKPMGEAEVRAVAKSIATSEP